MTETPEVIAPVTEPEPVVDPEIEVSGETVEELAARGLTPTGSLLNPPRDIPGDRT